MIPVLYVGPPGIGKTATVRAKYDHCEVVLLSSCTEEDISGLPYREDNKERRTLPLFIERLQKAKGKKCLFLDELDKARREVADTLLTLITHPSHFGIPDNTDIIAAANPVEWGGGDGISIPMMNRFAVVNFEVNIEGWVEFITAKYKHLPFINKLVEDIMGNKVPILECVGEDYNRRLTCPRSWDLALQASEEDMAAAKIMGLLTPNAASYLISCIAPKNDGELSEVQNISRKIGAKKIVKRIIT